MMLLQEAWLRNKKQEQRAEPHETRGELGAFSKKILWEISN